jgi:glyoxylase-like metal-dependent hydrolase (beta-lactamase superfamily II)
MSDLVFEQLFDADSSTYSYLIGDRAAGVAALVDPVREQIERDLERVTAHGLRLVHTIETHVHADHVTAGDALAARTGSVPVVHQRSAVECEARRVAGGDFLTIGGVVLEVLDTPGHTPESLSFRFAGRVLTGDALLIGTCGRTDFQGGGAGQLYDSIHQRLFTLPDETLVYPGHDYRGLTSSTIAVERRSNQRLAGRGRDEFVRLMSELGLPRPRKMDEALPANLRCGRAPQSA